MRIPFRPFGRAAFVSREQTGTLNGWRYVRPLTAAVIILVGSPHVVLAIPLFANGQGVSCDRCHTAPPNLNAYGRYLLATNFARGIDAHSQMKSDLRDPVSFLLTGTGSSPSDPTLPKTYVGNAGLLSGGFLGQNVSFYASVPFVSGGFTASAVDQLWAAYNGLSGGSGSLQIGKFPTPVFAPWLSQSLSLAGYSLAAMPVGLNSVGVGDNRWGTSYSQIGKNGLIGTVAYVTNTGPVERAFNGNVNDANTGAEGRSFIASAQFMNPGSHFTGGLATLGGTFPLPSGANDRFARAMALVSYSAAPSYSLDAMALVGHDANPTDGASGPAGSNGVSYEAIYSPNRWLTVNARYERTNDGLGTLQNNYVADLAVSLMPNLILTLENVSSVGFTPVTSYQLLWAGPQIRHSMRQVFAGNPAAPTATASSPTTAPSASQSKPSVAGVALTGKPLYAANCTACHGATGQGGVGPTLDHLATHLSFDATVAFIKAPAGSMPKLYPSVLSDQQVRDVAAYVQSAFH